MEATLTAPSGKSELCEIRDQPGSLYDIKFVPWEEGVHTVSLKYKGLHISGNPFEAFRSQGKVWQSLPVLLEWSYGHGHDNVRLTLSCMLIFTCNM